MAVEEMQARANQILRGEESEERKGAKLASLEGGRSRFSPFIPSGLNRALDLADKLMATADAQPGDAGVAAALDEAARAAETEDLRLVQHAVELIIHHPAASRLAIPPIPRPRSIGSVTTCWPTTITVIGILSIQLKVGPRPTAIRYCKTVRVSCSSTCTSGCWPATTPTAERCS